MQPQFEFPTALLWIGLIWNKPAMIARYMTAEEFAESRYELADGGQWAELVYGEPVSLHPPETAHGTVVLNLSKALAAWIERTRIGYACFELGLILSRSPDTVCCPPISYFDTGDRWAETDKAITETCPALVVEVPSTPDRVRLLSGRIEQYFDRGVAAIWVVDPDEQTVTVRTRHAEPQKFSRQDTLSSSSIWANPPTEETVLAGFSIPVVHVFREPDWWGRRSDSNA